MSSDCADYRPITNRTQVQCGTIRPMTRRTFRGHAPVRDAAPNALPAPGELGDAGLMTENEQTVDAGRCTCTGGPYLHGPEGLRQALREIEGTPETPAEGDTDDD